MPNDMGMSDEDYSARHRPLMDIDPMWTAFATQIGGRVIQNYHGRLERRITLVDMNTNLRRAIVLGYIDQRRDAAWTPLGPGYALSVGASYRAEQEITQWAEDIAWLKLEEVNYERLRPLLDRAWEVLKDVNMQVLRAKGVVTQLPPGVAVYPRNRYLE